jgi:hypothetical protein
MSETEIQVDQIRPGTAYELIGTNSGATKNIYLSLVGTSNEVTVTNSGATITLSTPITSAIAYTLPATRGTSGYFLQTDGSTATLVWAAGSGGVSSLNSLTGALSIVGTTNEIVVTPSGTNITLSTPFTSAQALLFPATTGTSGYFLQTNGSGTLSWVQGGGIGYREDYIVGTPLNNYTGSTTVFNLVNAYNVGGHTLIVTEDGDIQTLGGSADYLETNSTTVTFNYALVVGQRVSFIFSQPATSPSGTINSGTVGQLSIFTGSTTLSTTGNTLTPGDILVADSSGYPKTGITGSMSNTKITNLANGTAASDAAAFGQIGLLQTVYATYATQTSTTSTSYVDSGIAITINVKLNTSNVIIDADVPLYITGTSSGGAPIADLIITNSSNITVQEYLGVAGSNAALNQPDYFWTVRIRGFVATPSTGSITYKVRVRVNSASGAGTNTVKTCPSIAGQATAFITAQEIQ